MATLTGKVKAQREVSGKYKSGKRQGEEWSFLSIDIIDEDSGLVWSCQLSGDDEAYSEIAAESLVKHRVSVTVMGQTASEYTNQKGEKVMQVRSQIADVQDLGVAQKAAVA